MGEDWSEGKQEEITTDDLVLMLGEWQIKERRLLKIVKRYEIAIPPLQQELAKSKSTGLSVQTSLESERKQSESLRQRILQLEKQVHEIALERDEVKKELTVRVADSVKSGKRVKSPKAEGEWKSV